MANNNIRRTGIAALVAVVATAVGVAVSRMVGGSGEPAPPSGNPALAYRATVVRLAKAETGKADLNRYFASACPPCVGSHPSWCGIFALYILREAGLTDWQWAVGRGFVFRLKQTTDPQPGDLAYFDTYQHHAIVTGVHDGMVGLINGNGAGGVVSQSTAPIGKARAYYSIQPLIDAAIAARKAQ